MCYDFQSWQILLDYSFKYLFDLLNRSAHSVGPNRGDGPWGVLEVPWGDLGALGWVPGGRWEGPWEAQEAPRGGPGRHRKHRRCFQCVFGGSAGSPGVILVVGVGLGTDLGGGNVSTSFSSSGFWEGFVFIVLLLIFICNLLFNNC